MLLLEFLPFPAILFLLLLFAPFLFILLFCLRCFRCCFFNCFSSRLRAFLFRFSSFASLSSLGRLGEVERLWLSSFWAFQPTPVCLSCSRSLCAPTAFRCSMFLSWNHPWLAVCLFHWLEARRFHRHRMSTSVDCCCLSLHLQLMSSLFGCLRFKLYKQPDRVWDTQLSSTLRLKSFFPLKTAVRQFLEQFNHVTLDGFSVTNTIPGMHGWLGLCTHVSEHGSQHFSCFCERIKSWFFHCKRSTFEKRFNSRLFSKPDLLQCYNSKFSL